MKTFFELQNDQILKDNIAKAVQDLIAEKGTQDVTHPELGVVVKNGKPTHALIAFYKKLQRKRIKALERMQQNGRIEMGKQNDR